MSISEELQRIINAKSSIRNAIITKGVNVSSDLLLSSYADKILDISSGGGGASQADLNNIIDSLRSRGLDVPSNIGWSDVPYYIELLVKATDAESADSDFLISDQLAENEIYYRTTDNQPVSIPSWALHDVNGNNCNTTYNYYDPNSGYCKAEFDRNPYLVGYLFSNATNVTAVVFSNHVRQLDHVCYKLNDILKAILGRGVSIINNPFSGQPIASISLPSSVTSIGDTAFSRTSLYKIKSYASTAPTITQTSFFGIPSTGTVYIPKNADYSSWKSDAAFSGWTFIDNL